MFTLSKKSLPISDLGKKLISGTGYSYLSLLVNKLIGTFSSIYLARKLGPENLGVVSLVNYTIMFMLFLAGLGIPQVLIKLGSEFETKYNKNKRNEFIFWAVLIEIIVTLFFCFIYFISAKAIATRIYRRPILIDLFRISSLAVFFYALGSVINTIFCTVLEFKLNSLSQIFTYFTGFILIVPLAHFFGVKGAVLSGVFASIVSFLLALFIFLKIKKTHDLNIIPKRFFFNKNIAKNSIKTLFANSLPLFLSGLFTAPALPLLTVFLSHFCGLKAIGYFNIAYSLSQFVLFIPQAVGTPFVPLVSQLIVSERDKLKQFLFKTILSTGILVFVISFIMSFLGPVILSVLYGRDYLPSENILVLLLASTFLAGLLYIYGYYLIALGKMWKSFFLNFIWFIILVFASYLIIRKVGLIGSGISYLLAYIVLTSMMLYFIYKELKEDFLLFVTYTFVGMSIILLVLVPKLLLDPQAIFAARTLLLMFFILYLFSFRRKLYK
ncbi:MAG: flippase, partial [candidate division WOR-3 bacterium]|nr:flippase [candidate division WOR-3 bacterium]